MDWELIKSLSGVSLGKIGANTAYPAGHGREVVGLQPGLVISEYLTGETPQQVTTFIYQFMVVKGNFLLGEFRTIGWIHSTKKQWWSRIVSFALALFEVLLWQVGLYGAVRAIMHGILQSNHHFYTILERYNPETCTFFTPVREMGFTLMRCTISQGW